jgi:selenocysteine-specific elongation factor
LVDIGGHRYRRGEDAAARLEAFGIPLLVRESKYGLGLAELVARTGLMPAEIEHAAKSERLVALEDPQFWLMDRQWFQTALARIANLLETFHRENPLLAGMQKQELRSRELSGAPPFLLDAMIERAAAIVVEGETLRLATFQVVLKQDEEQATATIEKAFREAGLGVPAVNDVLAKSGVAVGRARSLLERLLRQGRLIRISGELVFHRDAIDGLRARLAARKGERLSVAQFKEQAGISRKYAIPLLEYLDREHVTRREGDQRVVLR